MIRIIRLFVGCLTFTCLYFILASRATAAISFTISNPVVDSDGSIEVDANISGLISSSCSSNGCYLQGQFQSSGGYFGMTYNNSGEFVDYFRTTSSIEEIKTKLFNFVPVSGSWSGKLKVKNNSLSPYYYGLGDYPLNFRRFSGNSVNQTSVESNILVINLTEELPILTPEESRDTPAPTPTPSPITLKTAPPTPAPSPIPTPTVTAKATVLPKTTSTPWVYLKSESSESAEVLGLADPATPIPTEVKDERKSPIVAIVITFLGIVLISVSVFWFVRKQKEKTLIQ